MIATDILSNVLDASSLSELPGAMGKKPKRVFLIYARQIHPDLFTDEEDKKRANEAFVHLGRLRDLSEGKKLSAPGQPEASVNRIKTKKHEYTLGDLLGEDDLFVKYEATFDAGHEEALLSLLKAPQDADLAETHVEALKALKEVPEGFRVYFPTLLESVRYRDTASGKEHTVVATQVPSGFRPMSDIPKVYPDGISGRDVAWMFRRMLVAVGNAHDRGLVNGAPTLDSFLIHDAMHGIILADWAYSVGMGQSLKAVPAAYRWAYPQKALDKSPVTFALDIHIIAEMAQHLLADGEPRQLTAFFKGCKISGVPQAPKLLAEFDTLLSRIYGKRTFHEFTLNTQQKGK